MACSPPGTELPVNKREFCEIFKFSQQAQRENLLSTGHLYGLYTTGNCLADGEAYAGGMALSAFPAIDLNCG
jgi:hypothetical protein